MVAQLKKKRQSEIVNYLKAAMNGFIADPPDSDYQRGYLAALKDTKDWINKA